MDFNVSNWIWMTNCDTSVPCIVIFKKNFVNSERIRISANSRYKLYINGEFIQEGPQKGTSEAAFVDTADFSEFKRAGINEAIVKVLYYPEDTSLRNDSLYHSPYPCLYIEDMDENGELSGREGWKAALDKSMTIVGEDFDPAPIHESEIVDGAKELVWSDAKPYNFFESRKPIAPFNLIPRSIPNMEHYRARFTDVVCVREGDLSLQKSWKKLIEGEECLYLAPNQTQIVEITAGEEMCGYPCLKLAGGKGAKIEILYSESYGLPQPDVMMPNGPRKMPPKKKNRLDYKNGVLSGMRDIYSVSGNGTIDCPEVYEPYLYRTFRFIQLKITTEAEALNILEYDYNYTGYPLKVVNHPISDRDDYNRIWDMSLRTLKRCMHETYIDCPFYERLQYTMDTRAEILFTYEVSDDDRLARNAMECFRKTQRSDGILQASAPAESVNVIPGFSIFYILMVHDHVNRFQDKELARHHFNCIDGILHYFDSHLTEKGLVGDVGGVLFQHPYWSFIDWCKEWDENIGVPTAKNQGDRSLTMESLLYLKGLEAAGEIAEFVGRFDFASEYKNKARCLRKSIMKYCVGKNGLFQDGPGIEEYSTHCQVWAILNDLVNVKTGIYLIEQTYRKEKIAQCSVSMSFYLIEAMHKCGILENHDDVWDPWRRMLNLNMTTCVENDTDERSDCHAWGAIMLYALPNYYQK